MAVKEPKTLLSAVLRSLRHRNFRLFTVGQSISLVGTWMQQVAVGWLVYTMTDSALLLGLVSFAAQGPTFVLAPLAGAIADRGNRRRLLLIVQSLMMVQALALAALVLSGKVEIWHIVALSAMLGCLSGFDIPIRQSFLVEMVEGREDLSNAIALNSSNVQRGAPGGTCNRRLRHRAGGRGCVHPDQWVELLRRPRSSARNEAEATHPAPASRADALADPGRIFLRVRLRADSIGPAACCGSFALRRALLRSAPDCGG